MPRRKKIPWNAVPGALEFPSLTGKPELKPPRKSVPHVPLCRARWTFGGGGAREQAEAEQAGVSAAYHAYCFLRGA
jgi:hypothetical protein